LKHQGEFLSAYAHCRVLTVKEGDNVKRGEKVAEIGHSGSAQTTLLHFEIRVRGKPVDPVQYLPSK
jgi:lipoprotein NlpD